ncbi:UNVERIFIED_CONTAM: hypothetical protein FKN15_017017 [Acipenser sinensis]
MDRNALAELLQALESRRDAEERRREERYTALIERGVLRPSWQVRQRADKSHLGGRSRQGGALEEVADHALVAWPGPS